MYQMPFVERENPVRGGRGAVRGGRGASRGGRGAARGGRGAIRLSLAPLCLRGALSIMF